MGSAVSVKGSLWVDGGRRVSLPSPVLRLVPGSLSLCGSCIVVAFTAVSLSDSVINWTARAVPVTAAVLGWHVAHEVERVGW